MSVDAVLMMCQALHAEVKLGGMYFHLLGVELTQKGNASELE